MPHTSKQIRTAIKRLVIDEDHRRRKNEEIACRMLTDEFADADPNFTSLSSDDIHTLFDHYDELYFGGLLRRETANTPVEFRVSSRMTRAGGKTTSWRLNRQAPISRLEIAISSTLLLRTFREAGPQRSILVTGLECENRLQAMMRVMEHEIVHLTEILGWGESSCRQDRYQTFAWQTFGHTDHQHALITPREHAASIGVRVGAQVQFEIEGESMTGIVNRVTKRATILVPSTDGVRFSDGNTYRKYYVPVESLKPVSSG